ncbi:MAG: hypothetical protein WBA68_02855 [Alteraurantiacibacter sp.]
MRLWPLAVLALLAGCSSEPEETEPELSDLYQRVDASFSDIVIDTPFDSVADTLEQSVRDECEQWGECDWRDADGVDHYVFGSTKSDRTVVLKGIAARNFEGRPIPALGIGMARQRDEVLENVETFLDGTGLDCIPGDAIESCGATIVPGWVTVEFDKDGALRSVRFEGYHHV